MLKKVFSCFLCFLLVFSGFILNDFSTNKLYAQNIISNVSTNDNHSSALKLNEHGMSQGTNYSQSVSESVSVSSNQSFGQNIGIPYSLEQNQNVYFGQSVGRSYSSSIGKSLGEKIGTSYNFGYNFRQSHSYNLGKSDDITNLLIAVSIFFRIPNSVFDMDSFLSIINAIIINLNIVNK